MTDLFYYDIANQVKVRANKAKVDELWVKDEETGDYARVLPAGSGETPVELPYWAKATKAEFENSSLNNAGLTVNGIDKTAVVSSTGVSLTDGALTEELTATDLPVLKQLGTREEVTSPPADAKVPFWNSSLSKYQVTPWRNYLGTDNIAFPDVVNYRAKFDKDTFSLNASSPSVQGTASVMTPYSLRIGTRLAGTTTVSNAHTRAIITPTYIGITTGGNDSAYFINGTIGMNKNNAPTTLTWDTLSELNNFVGKTELITPTAANKMVLFDPVTKGYRYSAIPAATVLPSWVQPSQAAFENLTAGDTRGTYVDSEKILLRPHITNPSPTTGDTMTITRSGITAGRYGTDSLKTVLTKSQIDFYNGSSTATSLTKFDVDKLKPTKFTVTSGWHLPKILDNLETGPSATPCPVLDLKPGCTVYIDVMGGAYLSYNQWHAIKINNTGPDAIYEMEVVACYNTNYHSPNERNPVFTRLEDQYNIPRVIWHRTGNAFGSIPAATLVFKLGNTNGSFSSGQSFQGVIKLKYVGNGVSTLPAVTTI